MSELVSIAVFGKQCSDFLETEIGRYITGCSKQQIDAALDGLRNAKTIEEVNELQSQIRLAEAVPMWINEAILGGLDALAALEEE